jgi:hypothetical protein
MLDAPKWRRSKQVRVRDRSAPEGRRLAQRAVLSQTAEFSKTARSVALRGGLIEGHTGARQIQMPIVGKRDVRTTETAATTRQGQSAVPFFRSDEKARGARCRSSARARPRPRLVRLKPDTTEASRTSAEFDPRWRSLLGDAAAPGFERRPTSRHAKRRRTSEAAITLGPAQAGHYRNAFHPVSSSAFVCFVPSRSRFARFVVT